MQGLAVSVPELNCCLDGERAASKFKNTADVSCRKDQHTRKKEKLGKIPPNVRNYISF
jgi:hypothetical protein